MEDKKLEILVVEDVAENIEAAKQYFSSRPDVNVDYAVNFEEAIEKLEGDKIYAGAILDINFPRAEGEPEEILGIELGKQLDTVKGKYRIPHIFLSGFQSQGHGPMSRIFADEISVERDKSCGLVGSKARPDAYKAAFNVLLDFCPYMAEIVEAKERAKKYGDKK